MKTHFSKVVAEMDEDIAKLRADIQRLEQARFTLDELYGGSGETEAPAPEAKPKRVYKKRAVKPAPLVVMAAPARELVPTNGHAPTASESPEDNSEATPLGADGIALGRKLANPFTATDLGARLDGGVPRAYTWVAAWKRKAWIEQAGFGQYRRTDSFGT